MRACVAILVSFSLAAPAAWGQDASSAVQAASAAAAPAGAKPANITDPVIRLDGAPTAEDQLYESRVLGAFRSRQGNLGPLDGRWHVAGSDGVVLYTLQLSDPGSGADTIEGAWSNPKAKGEGSSGFIDSVRREDADIVLSFREAEGAAPTEVRLHPATNGGFTGETVRAGHRLGVIANRAQSVETAALAVPAWNPPPPPKIKAKAKKKGKATRSKSKAKAKKPVSKKKKR